MWEPPPPTAGSSASGIGSKPHHKAKKNLISQSQNRLTFSILSKRSDSAPAFQCVLVLDATDAFLFFKSIVFLAPSLDEREHVGNKQQEGGNQKRGADRASDEDHEAALRDEKGLAEILLQLGP
jgi:hypothetical protein